VGELRTLQIAACPEEDVARLERELGVSGAMAQVLVRRGWGDPAAAQAFLAGEQEHPASAFAGIEQAIEPILRHARNRERITIHGDYDVDGICSTAVLVRALRALGADVDWYLPDRAGDGYGLNLATVERLAERGTQLLVSADCAITAVEEVAAARALGMEVVVSDHHAPRADGRLPQAPIVHPRVCGYPCPDLCATAVAYKLAQALWDAAAADAALAQRASYRVQDDLDLVALATIADVVPLVGENRTLVRRGLGALASTAKPGLRALMAVAKVDPSGVSERAVGFALAPRLNAAGRLYRADAGLELVLTEDPARAGQIAQELDRANQERRHTETRILFEAEAQVAACGESAAYVLAGEGWHPGVIGIVASRIAERHHRPVVMIALEGDEGRGSGRSIEGFDLLGGLQACAAHLGRHGGHRAAAGLQLERSRLEDFREAFVAHAARTLDPEQLVRGERVDAVLAGSELGMALAEELKTLAPFGAGNPTVSLLVRGALLADRRPMGEGRHLRFSVLAGDGARARAVAFGNGGRLPLTEDAPADATFTLEVNEWKGVSEPRLVLRHAQPAAGVESKIAGVASQTSSVESPTSGVESPTLIKQWQLPGIESLLEQRESASSR
jgi:single-stranded-DNA-specific exonuclease